MYHKAFSASATMNSFSLSHWFCSSLCLSSFQVSIRCFSSVAGINMSTVRICRLNGSWFVLSRCRTMTGLSMITPLGSWTGSVIRVSIRGSGGKARIYKCTCTVEPLYLKSSSRQGHHISGYSRMPDRLRKILACETNFRYVRALQS